MIEAAKADAMITYTRFMPLKPGRSAMVPIRQRQRTSFAPPLGRLLAYFGSQVSLGTLYLLSEFILMIMLLTETLALLPEARRFVTEGERLIIEQHAVVRILERDGYDTLDAIEHLELLEGMQAEYVEHLEKLERRVLVLVRSDA
jgi:hypothetical protein